MPEMVRKTSPIQYTESLGFRQAVSLRRASAHHGGVLGDWMGERLWAASVHPTAGAQPGRSIPDKWDSPPRLTEITERRQVVTAGTALRLAARFGISPGFRVGLRADYGLESAERPLGERIAREVVAPEEERNLFPTSGLDWHPPGKSPPESARSPRGPGPGRAPTGKTFAAPSVHAES